MKRILCFGDSNTYGLAFSPEKGPYRLDEGHRWTCLLQKELGPEYRIIEEGLNGRTTAYDVPASDTPPLFDAPNFASRNGAAFLPMCLESHSPLDLVILNLGTNDSTKLFGLGTPDIVEGMRTLVEIVRAKPPVMVFPTPRILIIAPVPLSPLAMKDAMMTDEGALKRSAELAGEYEKLAEELACDFFDLNTIPCHELVDGVHLTEESHAAAAHALAEKIRSLAL